MLGALAASPIFTQLAAQFGLVDIPGSAPHKLHARPTPMAGGPVLAAAMALGLLLQHPSIDRATAGMMVGGASLLAWGLLDDAIRMPPLLKLLGQVIVLVMLIVSGTQVHATQQPVVDLAISTLWVLGIINAFNFVDSMDGLAAGLASVALAFFMLVTLDSGQPQLAGFSAAALGGTLGLFFFNASPARMFLGDSGSQLLGFILAAIGIAYVPAGAGLPQGVTWFTPILVLGVPIFDTSLVVFSRLRRRKPIYTAERDHTYHRLLGLGLSPARSVLAMQLAAVLLGLLAFTALDLSVLMANVVFAAVVATGIAAAAYLELRTPVLDGAVAGSAQD